MRLKVLSATLTIAGALATGVGTGAALAAPSQPPCNASPVFAATGDNANYVEMHAVAGGSNQRTAQVTSASAPLTFKGSCVAFLEPVVRFTAQNIGSTDGTLTVSVQYRDKTGVNHDDLIATLSGYPSSQLTPILTFDASQVSGNVQVTVTANGAGANWLVSGVYIDPFVSH